MSDMSVQERANALFQNAEILAPMVRASTTPLRLLALSYGANLIYTEEIVDRAITSTDRILNKKLNTIDYVKRIDTFSPKVQKKFMTNKESLPVVLRIVPELERGKLIYQMGTGEANLALEAALKVVNDVDGIDINMGCPKKFSVSGGMGSALLSDLPRSCDILQTLRRNIPHIPLSCKIRLLKDVPSTIDFVTGLINAGANAITIHGRQVGDESVIDARWDMLVEVVQLLKSSCCRDIPVIINGDLYTRNAMVNMRRRAGADGVMLARPALYNTSIFRKPPPLSSSLVSTTNEEEKSNKNDTQQNDNDDDTSDANSNNTPPTNKNEEETRYGYNSPLLLSKTQVIQEYLQYANLYQSNPKNIKYVICEMMNNRRTPSSISYLMPQSYPGGQTINTLCKCKTLDQLCKIWDVSTTSSSSSSSSSKLLNTTKLPSSSSSSNLKSSTNEGVNKTEVVIEDTHRYDDRYFLDPEALKKERDEEEKLLEGRKKAKLN